jgi:diguanylate cyclase (GGDEF)-like protein
MSHGAIKVLLIEDNRGDACLVRELLKEIKDASFELECCERLEAGLKLLSQVKTDIIITDLMLPDSRGLDTLKRVLERAGNLPVIVLTGIADMQIAIKSAEKGAQDYLVKEYLNSYLLNKTIRLAIERQRKHEKLRSMSYIDELTGLYNRRGFFKLAEQKLKLDQRLNRDFYLIYLDIDSMKWINDNLGHHEGDQALISVSRVLKDSFRQSDLIARIGGDEFAILACGVDISSMNEKLLTQRIHHNLKERSKKNGRPYKLSVSIGIIDSKSAGVLNVDEMLKRADCRMYRNKRNK